MSAPHQPICVLKSVSIEPNEDAPHWFVSIEQEADGSVTVRTGSDHRPFEGWLWRQFVQALAKEFPAPRRLRDN